MDIKISRHLEGGFVCYWARGHHDPVTFCEKVKEEFGPKPGAYNSHIAALMVHCATPDKVEVIHVRLIPRLDKTLHIHRSKPGHGSFPVTLLEL